jgi:hypothetical protein
LNKTKNKLPLDFGAEYGKPVKNIHEVLNKLDKRFPFDLELLLSYSTSIILSKNCLGKSIRPYSNKNK